MQPYIFPYLGYYQLAHCSDVFVMYDDATFIKQGYINRNTILVNGRPLRFTIPVPGASSNELIKNLKFAERTAKVVETIRQAYSKAPYFDDVFPLVEGVIKSKDRGIPDVCQKGISEVFRYLGLRKDIVRSSDVGYDRSASAEDKLIQICRSFGSNTYVNSVGGKKLYSKGSFAAKGCDLLFIEMKDVRYRQRARDFIPNLSIIDALMHCPPDEVRSLLDSYVLA